MGTGLVMKLDADSDERAAPGTELGEKLIERLWRGAGR